MAAADRVAVHRGDHRLGHLADQPVQGLDLEQPRLRRAVVAGLGALLLVAAGAEGAIAGAGQADDADLGARPRPLEAADQLVDRAGAERVHALRAVDRDPGEAVLDLVADVGQLLHRRPPSVAWSATLARIVPWSRASRAGHRRRPRDRPRDRRSRWRRDGRAVAVADLRLEEAARDRGGGRGRRRPGGWPCDWTSPTAPPSRAAVARTGAGSARSRCS